MNIANIALLPFLTCAVISLVIVIAAAFIWVISAVMNKGSPPSKGPIKGEILAAIILLLALLGLPYLVGGLDAGLGSAAGIVCALIYLIPKFRGHPRRTTLF